SYFSNRYDNGHHDVPEPKPEPIAQRSEPAPEPREHRPAQQHTSSSNGKPATRHFSRPGAHARDRKPAQSSAANRSARRPGSDARKSSGRVGTSSGARWSAGVSKSEHSNRNGKHAANGSTSRHHANGNGARVSRPVAGSRDRNGSHATWGKHNGHNGNGTNGASRNGNGARNGAKTDARSRKPLLTAGAKAGNSRRYGFRAAAKPGTKKRG
ncbi:MAG TPA: hypothetical protein VF730_09710, partial [Terracidiphilus sp.]